MLAKKGLFISVEGIDGAGKSTHIPFIKSYLETKGYQVKLARDPGGTDLGDKIRELLLNDKMNSITELLLMFASRQELISQVIMPSLNAGICVLSDRFVEASFAYQGAGRLIGQDKVKALSEILTPSIKTDLTLVFDVSLLTAQNRLSLNRKKDRIEGESREFFERVRAAYINLSLSEPHRVKIINSEGTIPQIQQLIANALDDLTNLK
jgi:dTMP kinase